MADEFVYPRDGSASKMAALLTHFNLVRDGFMWNRIVLPVVFMVGLLVTIGASSGRIAAQSTVNRNTLAAAQQKHRELYREFSGGLEKLIEFCDGKGFTEATSEIRGRLISPESQLQKWPALPRELRADVPNQLSADERYWQTQLREYETDYAKKLFLLSRQPLYSGNPGYAYQLVREAAFHDPNHVPIRKILGFVQAGNEWVTPFAADQIRKGNVWHEDFGWLPKSHLARYSAGDRNFRGRWISAAKEELLRQDFSEAWQVRTDHYLIKTNVSLERGVELGKSLEDYYEFFNEMFAGFFNTPEQLRKLFEGTARSVRPDVKPYLVHYYRSREEYLERLRKQFPTIEQTNGVYMTNDRVAHFYHDPDAENDATLFHEATHQLFFESHNQSRPIGEHAHFWIIEGIACYMESFQRQNGILSVGDPRYIRFAGARANVLSENRYYVPLRTFSGMGMQQFQLAPKPELPKNYTQASGLAWFFMHYEQGRYREALVSHLSELYSGDGRIRDRATGLDELTGVDFEDLDRQYLDYARKVDESLVEQP